jgi:branched-chain amino acid transport system permease protein
VAGLASGCLYALVALGLVLVHRTTRVLNFAHGDLGTFGAFVAFRALGAGLPVAVAALIGVAVGAALAAAFSLLVLSPAQRNGARPATLFILTLGFAQLLQGGVLELFGAEPQRLRLPASESRQVVLGPLAVSELSLAVFLTTLLCCALLYLVVQRTRVGLALRAVSEDQEATASLGIPTRALLALAWALSAALAVVTGILLAATLLLDSSLMFEPQLKGFAGAVLGGLDSLPGAVAGGLLLGAAESLGGAAFGLPFRNSLGFVVIVLVLLFRPSGLFGRSLKERA